MSLSVVLLCLVLGLVTYIVARMKKRINYFQSLGIPCIKPNFILGNVTGIQTERNFAAIWEEHYKRFKGTGPFSGFYWFQRPGVFILDPALIKLILIKDFNNFVNRGFYINEEDDPLTGQLFLLEGHKWRNMRNKVSPTFTSGKMKFMFPTVIKVGQEFVEVLSDMVEKDTIIEVKELLARFTTDVIGTCAFGIDCSSLKDPEAEFRVMGRKALVEDRHGPLILALMNSFPELARKLHMKITKQTIEDFFLRIVRETVTYREQNNIRRNDFMDMLINLKNNKSIKQENGEDLTNLTMEQVAAQAFVFFFAGFETSSTTMSFALYELAQHEDVQQKAREEVLAVLEKHNQVLNYECMKELNYLEQIIDETLRLYTIVPVLNRVAVSDYEVPGHPKYVIKKDMPVFIPAGAIHRDAEYYPNPEQFNPDNFAPEKVRERDSILWLPFGEGPRNCVGMRFGQMQTRIGLALLLKHFKFSVCPQTQIPIKYDKRLFIVNSEGGIILKVEKI